MRIKVLSKYSLFFEKMSSLEAMMRAAFWILFLAKSGETKNKQLPKRTDDLVIPKTYFKEEPPVSDGATDVSIGIYVNTFYAISEQTMDYSVSMYFRQAWIDPRLAYIPEDNKTDKVKLEVAWKTIWVPDTFFRNEKKSGFHSVTVDNRMLTVRPNGYIWYAMKITATLSCPMELHKYPLDNQTCPMMFESFGYTVDIVNLIWLIDPKPVVVDKDMSLPQFTYDGYDLADCSVNYTTGSLPCLQINFRLHRDLGYYFIQLFVPSILIVILSWVSFWINVDAAPARVSLGLLTVLTMSNHSIGINANLPRVSYIKAVDIWMSSCLLFVFSALCEYAFVNVASRHRVIDRIPASTDRKHKKDLECGSCLQINSHRIDHDETGAKVTSVPSTKPSKVLDRDGKARARGIDKMARKSFPLAFILFNIIYWVGYIYYPG